MKIGKYVLVKESDLAEIYARADMIDRDLELKNPEAAECAAGKIRATTSAIMKIIEGLLK